jgi:hypothetical protein
MMSGTKHFISDISVQPLVALADCSGRFAVDAHKFHSKLQPTKTKIATERSSQRK